MKADQIDQVTAEQVSASLATAGLRPVGAVHAIADVVSSQFAATRAAFSTTSFTTEPSSFLIALIQESK